MCKYTHGFDYFDKAIESLFVVKIETDAAARIHFREQHLPRRGTVKAG